MHIPFVVYDGYFGETEGICNLSIDDYDGGRQMGEYLKRMGHEKVLCIADNYICMDKERIEGCKAALGEEKVGFLQIPFEKEARKRMYRERLYHFFGIAIGVPEFNLYHFLSMYPVQIGSHCPESLFSFRKTFPVMIAEVELHPSFFYFSFKLNQMVIAFILL